MTSKVNPQAWVGKQVRPKPDDPRNGALLMIGEAGTVLDSWFQEGGPSKGRHRLDVQIGHYKVRCIDADQFQLV